MKTYPKGTVRELLATDAVTPPTRIALEARLETAENYRSKFFDAELFAILQAVCRRLTAQDAIDCAAFIDQNFSANKSDGWRYDKLPNDAETFRRGLRLIDDTARAKFGAAFINLANAEKDEVLSEIQKGKASDGIRKDDFAEMFFVEILARTTEVFYAHPLAQEEIGYVGMADADGWERIKLNEREAREPRISEKE